MKNVGKKFEDNFKKSIPSYCMIHRLKDSAQSYNNSVGTKFTWNNPCDYFLFDSKGHILYCLELKTTKYKSIAYEDINSDKPQNKMIHKHQILSLLDFSKYENVVAGFIFNFRDEAHDMERTYFQDVKDFVKMCKDINKFSFNEIDILLNNAIKIEGTKKRVNFIWNIEKLLSSKRRNNYDERD